MSESTAMHERHKVAGLFAGIGGLEIGLASAGFKTALLSEIEPAASLVLEHRFRTIENVGDITKLSELPPEITMVSAGFPCQDLSSSGLKEGIEGQRSSLVGQVFKLLKDRKDKGNPVEWVVIENVQFMLHLNRGAGIRHVVEGLEALSYKWAYRLVDSINFGLAQRRRRVFVVASMTNDPRDVLLSSEAGMVDSPIPTPDLPLGFYWTEGTYARGLAVNAVPPLKGGSTIGIPSAPAILFPTDSAFSDRVVTPSIEDAERLQGFDAGWTEPACAKYRASLRWKMVGNAVSVPVARWVGSMLAAPVSYDASQDQPIRPGARWPNAAWNVGAGRFASRASEAPVRVERPALSEFVRDPRDLSARATAGFLNRVRKGSLDFPEWFVPALEAHHARMTEIS